MHLLKDRATDVLIVGAGAIGLAIADRLAGEGVAVRLLEAESAGAGASGAAAGMLAPVSEAEGDSPLLRLGLESLAGFEGLCTRLKQETGIDPELERSGLLHAAFSEAELEALEGKRLKLEQAEGRAQWAMAPVLEPVDGESLRASGLGLGEGVVGGLLSPLEAHLRPPLLVRALEASARSRGARIESGVRANRLRLEAGRIVGVESSEGMLSADAVVVCAGVWTPSLLQASGVLGAEREAGMIEPVRGQILCLEAPLPAASSIVWAAGAYLVPKRDGSWVVGATQERVGFDRRVTAEGIAWLLDRARRAFPGIADASFASAWAGLRPVSADGLPWIGAWPGASGLFVAAGHGRNGVLLAPVTARLVVDALLGKVSGSEAERAVEPARGWRSGAG
ncbi:MAG: glycine oxidase ThiO [Deltaproteobacteria bacterium]|jgi:glycine oxidase|nr:glycine oxidase ThiO [Deltaproteobacteria bacterium]